MACLVMVLRRAACWLWLVPAVAVTPLGACETDHGEPVMLRLAHLTDYGDVVLADRSTGRLAGIRLLQAATGAAEPDAVSLAAFVMPWRERGMVLKQPGAGPDRWGRHGVSVLHDGGGPDRDLALGLVRSGLAMAWPVELPPNCRNLYLQAEASARLANRGRWIHMQHATLDASRGADVATRAGQVTIMSGRINHVGQTRRASYLNFGVRGTGASAEMGLSVWRGLEGQGWTRDSLKGKMVRVRGVVMEGRPARLLLGDVSAIEFLN